MYNVYQDNYKKYFPSPHFREGKKWWCEFRIQTFYLRISGKTELKPKLHNEIVRNLFVGEQIIFFLLVKSLIKGNEFGGDTLKN